MIGAILGDMIGAPYEFDRGNKSKDFPLFGKDSVFTDDSVMTIAVAEALLDSMGKSDEEVRQALTVSMQKWGRRYPDAGYGGMFYHWLREKDPEPYGSFGNGSAMRVSSAGWLYESLEVTRKYARLTAEVTHNHPEGIKGAEAVASVIWMARNGSSKEEIRRFICREFNYDLSRTCDQIRPGYHHVETCQETVPEAITAFLEGESFEDVVRTAVSLGGDCDTLTCIAASMAEAFHGVPVTMTNEGLKRLPEDMKEVLDRFQGFLKTMAETYHNSALDGNEIIEEAIDRFEKDRNRDTLLEVLEAIRIRMREDGHFLFPVYTGGEDSFTLQAVRTDDGRQLQVAFTSKEEFRKGEESEMLSTYIDTMLQAALDTDSDGFVINPWGQSFILARGLIEMIFKAEDQEEEEWSAKIRTPEDLADGSLLKEAIHAMNVKNTRRNFRQVLELLRDSVVWIPCNAVLSDEDYARVEEQIRQAQESGNPGFMIGKELETRDAVHMVPDILQNKGEDFFPVFVTIEDMGEYGEKFSKVQKHFLEVIVLAGNNKKNVSGIVVNAFSEPFVLRKEMFTLVKGMESRLKKL